MSRHIYLDEYLLPEHAFKPRAGRLGGMTLEGGKASSAPAPDPRLVDAQIKSMDKQGEALDEIMSNSRRLAPLQEQSMQFGLDTGRQAWQQAQDDRQWSLGRRNTLTSLQDSLASDAASYNQPAEQERMATEAGSDVASSFGLQRQQLARTMGSYGVDPSMGAFGAAMGTGDGGAGAAEAAARATAMNKVRQAARDMGWSRKVDVANMFSGYPGMGMQATGAGAGYGAGQISIANSGLSGMNSGWGSAGTVAGQMGSNATSMWGTQATFKNQADKIAADSDPTSSILGAATGVGMSAGLNALFPKKPALS